MGNLFLSMPRLLWPFYVVFVMGFHSYALAESVSEPQTRHVSVKRLSLTADLALSSIYYSDAAVSNFSEIALTPKVSARYWLKPLRWDLAGSVAFTTLPFASNLPSVTAQFLNINVRTGYFLPFVHLPWSLDLMGGLFYSDSFVTGSSFGYTNLLYPGFYPILRRVMTPREALGLYVKIVPMEKGLSLGLSQRELATGLQWERLLSSGNQLSVNLDYSSLIFLPSNTNTSTSTTSLGFGLGYGF